MAIGTRTQELRLKPRKKVDIEGALFAGQPFIEASHDCNAIPASRQQERVDLPSAPIGAAAPTNHGWITDAEAPQPSVHWSRGKQHQSDGTTTHCNISQHHFNYRATPVSIDLPKQWTSSEIPTSIQLIFGNHEWGKPSIVHTR